MRSDVALEHSNSVEEGTVVDHDGNDQVGLRASVSDEMWHEPSADEISSESEDDLPAIDMTVEESISSECAVLSCFVAVACNYLLLSLLLQ